MSISSSNRRIVSLRRWISLLWGIRLRFLRWLQPSFFFFPSSFLTRRPRSRAESQNGNNGEESERRERLWGWGRRSLARCARLHSEWKTSKLQSTAAKTVALSSQPASRGFPKLPVVRWAALLAYLPLQWRVRDGAIFICGGGASAKGRHLLNLCLPLPTLPTTAEF